MIRDSDHTVFFILALLFVLSPFVVLFLPDESTIGMVFLLWFAIIVIFLHYFSEFGRENEISQELAGLEYSPEGNSALKTSIDEARQTLDSQIENLSDIDEKASKILRINVLIIGVILSALTLSSNQNTPVRESINIYLLIGFAFLIVSTATAGLTYTSSSLRIGMSKSDIVTMFKEDLDSEELDHILSKSYAQWIRSNQSTEILNSFYSTSTILLLVFGVSFLTLGLYDSLVDSVPQWLLLGTVAFLLVTILASGYYTQIKNLLNEIRFRIE